MSDEQAVDTAEATEAVAQEAEAPSIPEGFPEKYLRDGQPDYNELTKAYNEVSKRLSTRTDDLLKQEKEKWEQERFSARPEAPDNYEVGLPDELKDQGLAIDESSPLMQWYRETAFNNGWTQEQFVEGINAFMDYQLSMAPDVEAEKSKLGENADQRIEAVGLYLKSNLSEEQYASLERAMVSAEALEAIETLIGKNNLAKVRTENAQSGEGLTLEKLRQMQNDPRYYDPAKRDPQFIKEVQEGYERLFAGQQTQTANLHPSNFG